MSKREVMMILVAAIAMLLAVTAAVAQPSGDRPMPPPGGQGGPGMPPGVMWPTFTELDQNGDGSITASESASGWAQVDKAEFSRLDLDANGMLSKDELQMGRGPGPQGRGPRGPRPGTGGDATPPGPPPGQDAGNPPPGPPPDQMGGTPPPRPPSPEELDANSDGNVTLEEYTSAWKTMHESMFTRQDANSDGALTEDEFPKAPARGARPCEVASRGEEAPGATDREGELTEGEGRKGRKEQKGPNRRGGLSGQGGLDGRGGLDGPS